jgi:hypothetical protein
VIYSSRPIASIAERLLLGGLRKLCVGLTSAECAIAKFPLVDLGGFHRYRIVYIRIFGDPRIACISLILNGRGERIRTSDPLVPNQIQVAIEVYCNLLATTGLD